MAALIILPFLITLASTLTSNHAQVINTACSSSMISSFTPCLNFVTGSSGGRSSPTRDCCSALKSLLENNMECACLIITGNVPVTIPFINANLGSTLPRACNSNIPLQCTSTGVPLPAPGPVLFAPPPPPAAVLAPAPTPFHAHSPKGSKAVTAAASPPAGELDIAPEPSSPPESALGPGANPGIRPVVNHNNSSAASNLFAVSLPYIVVMFAGIIASKFF